MQISLRTNYHLQCPLLTVHLPRHLIAVTTDGGSSDPRHVSGPMAEDRFAEMSAPLEAAVGAAGETPEGTADDGTGSNGRGRCCDNTRPRPDLYIRNLIMDDGQL